MTIENSDPVDHRLTAVEVKVTFTEDLVEELNRAVARQQQQIDLLLREVMQLRQQLEHADADDRDRPRSLRDEIPPHY